MPFWEAYSDLDRDRGYENLSLGMAGGVRLPESVPIPKIRAEGRRRGYSGDELEGFVLIIRMADDHKKSSTWLRVSAEVKRKAELSKGR